MKRQFAALLLLLIFARAQASVAFRCDDGCCLLDESGAEIVSWDTYADIRALGQDLFAAEQSGKYALMCADGELHTGFLYDAICATQTGAVLLCEDSLWGIADADGTIVADCAYEKIVSCGAERYFAICDRTDDARAGMLVILSGEGAVTETELFVSDMGDAFKDGLLRVLLSDEDLYGYCNADGRMEISARYEYAGDFCEGIAVVFRDGKYGAIDAAGEYILPCEYRRVETSGDRILAVTDDGCIFLLDTAGNVLLKTTGVYACTAGEYCFVSDGNRGIVFDHDGAAVGETSPSAAICAGIGDDLIVSDGAWGEECVYLLETDVKYQNIYPIGISSDRARYAYMVVDTVRYNSELLGETQLSMRFENARYGLIDSNGNVMIPAAYLKIEYIADDRYVVRTKTRWQMIDEKENVLYSHAANAQ